jgi:hypothetical protein
MTDSVIARLREEIAFRVGNPFLLGSVRNPKRYVSIKEDDARTLLSLAEAAKTLHRSIVEYGWVYSYEDRYRAFMVSLAAVIGDLEDE